MILWLIVGAGLAVMLVAAYFADRKSRRIRGHARPGHGWGQDGDKITRSRAQLRSVTALVACVSR